VFRLFAAASMVLLVTPPATAADTLRSVAERKDLKIGVMALDNTWNTPQQKALVASEFNVVTVGTYWKRTHPSPEVYDWAAIAHHFRTAAGNYAAIAGT
jgi:hypothetical protein